MYRTLNLRPTKKQLVEISFFRALRLLSIRIRSHKVHLHTSLTYLLLQPRKFILLTAHFTRLALCRLERGLDTFLVCGHRLHTLERKFVLDLDPDLANLKVQKLLDLRECVGVMIMAATELFTCSAYQLQFNLPACIQTFAHVVDAKLANGAVDLCAQVLVEFLDGAAFV